MVKFMIRFVVCFVILTVVTVVKIGLMALLQGGLR
jgi:hypothetical protein